MLAHQYVGAAAAVRSAGRRDVWVAASDLDEGTATSLLHGGWPIMITYSLPIAGSGLADANVMGKILLGKKVPVDRRQRGYYHNARERKGGMGEGLGRREISVEMMIKQAVVS